MFAWVTPLILRWLVVAVIGAALLAFGWVKGDQHGTKKLTDYQGEQAKAAVKIITRQGAITEKVVTEYRDRVTKGATITKTIEKKVTEYVESKPLTLSCTLDAGWIGLHDAAAAGSIPDSTGRTPSEVRTPAAPPKAGSPNIGG